MKTETMEQILAGTKSTYRISGYKYDIIFGYAGEEDVALVPRGSGSTAFSDQHRQEYGYTHGGRIYRKAVDVAKEVAEAWREKRRSGV